MVATNTISDQFISQVGTRLSENKRVRQTLPIWGRVHIDRQLPFYVFTVDQRVVKMKELND